MIRKHFLDKHQQPHWLRKHASKRKVKQKCSSSLHGINQLLSLVLNQKFIIAGTWLFIYSVNSLYLELIFQSCKFEYGDLFSFLKKQVLLRSLNILISPFEAQMFLTCFLNIQLNCIHSTLPKNLLFSTTCIQFTCFHSKKTNCFD